MKNRIIILLLVVIFLLCACSNEGKTSSNEVTSAVFAEPELFSTDPLEKELTKSYSIEEFYNYFGPYCTVFENQKHNYVSDLSVYKYDNVVSKFPDGCLRVYIDELNQSQFVYSVFKVATGGYYYVFWGGLVDDNGIELDENWLQNRFADGMLYVDDLNSYEDFESVEIGVSTAEDVAQIDPAAYFNFGMSRGTVSWHLLNDGTIIEISYQKNDDYYTTYSRKDMTVQEVKPVDRNITRFYLAYINLDDLP